MVENEEEELSQETVTFLYKLSAGACPKVVRFQRRPISRRAAYDHQQSSRYIEETRAGGESETLVPCSVQS